MPDDEIADRGPLYRVERTPGSWRVIGPNGVVADFPGEAEAQAKADLLNEDAAEESEGDS